MTDCTSNCLGRIKCLRRLNFACKCSHSGKVLLVKKKKKEKKIKMKDGISMGSYIDLIHFFFQEKEMSFCGKGGQYITLKTYLKYLCYRPNQHSMMNIIFCYFWNTF